MFTTDHIADMADFFVGLQNFFDRAPEYHIAALAMVLSEYQNQHCAQDGPGDPAFGAILMEVGGICADAAQRGETKLDACRGALRDQQRLNLAAEAVIYAIAEDTTPQDAAKAQKALVDSYPKPPAEKGPQASNPKRKPAPSKKGPKAVKSKRSKRKAA